MADRPLEGRRIGVTRPLDQASSLVAELEPLGATVEVVPLLALEPLEDVSELENALRDLSHYDWVIFTSASGVAVVRKLLKLTRDFGETKVAAVGPATANAIRSLEIEPSFVPTRYAADEIAAGLGPLDDARVLLPQADIADPNLADALRARGARVDAIAIYRTIELEPTSEGLSALQSVDAIVLASGSAARSLASLDHREEWPLIVCIGPKTAEVARAVGLPVGLVADEATSEGIIKALVSHFDVL